MGISLVKFQLDKEEKWGLWEGDVLRPFQTNPPSLKALMASPAT